MKKLPQETLRKVQAVEDALAHYSLTTDSLSASMEALRELLDTDKAALYTLKQRPASEDLMLARSVTVTYEPGSWRRHLDEYLEGRGVAWGSYNVGHPEPAQRDRVLRSAEVAALTSGRNLAVQRFLYARLGNLGDDTMRVLVCDGPSLLGWLGIMQPVPTTERQRQLFDRVLASFRNRLAFERVLGESTFASDALAGALEEVNGAAWLLGPLGQIVHANAAGRARFDADRARTLADLAACVGGTNPPRYKVRTVRGQEGRRGHVVVETPGTSGPQRIPEAARRFGLTPAQTRVLERVARGISNATIAAELGVAERTVEAHVTAILVKAQVPSRAALIVQIFQDLGGT